MEYDATLWNKYWETVLQINSVNSVNFAFSRYLDKEKSTIIIINAISNWFNRNLPMKSVVIVSFSYQKLVGRFKCEINAISCT
jgi:hypothetical protein